MEPWRAVNAHNRGRGGSEGCGGSVDQCSHHFDDGQDPDPHKVDANTGTQPWSCVKILIP
jgi:hypothetical protein